MSDEQGSPDLAALVRAAQRGDRSALEALVAEIRPQVHRYVLSRLIDRAGAEDVTQEVTLAVVTSLPRYVDTGVPVIAWVFGIAMRKVGDAHRSLGRHRDTSVASIDERLRCAVDEEPEPTALRLETSRQMARLLAGLPHPQGEILRLRIAAGLSAEETAAIVGMTPGAVRVAQHRALARLRARVASEVVR